MHHSRLFQTFAAPIEATRVSFGHIRPIMPRWPHALRQILPFLAAVSAAAGQGARLEFNRDIRPILSESCFQCHGQDPAKREAKLRLDERESATLARDGIAAIVPGRPDDSELMRRVLSKDTSEQMPPPESHKSVTPAQVAILRQWIAEGAVYQKHWAFVAPARAPLPKIAAARWPRGALDRFVLARLEQEKLAPSPEAAPETWLRRASLDLVGLPPTPAELDAFSADVARRGEPAYAAAAERLLASPHFGERQASEWLDAARYADTHGFNNDSARTMWRWRDWVIEAFNANLPYDRFITEQLAGDLLPAPTLEQRIATGFGRNHVISSEGGIIAEEYRVEYVADRVRTLSTVWLGLTLECAKCHDHKFDPVTQRDYYRMFAFFNNVPEHGEDGRVANAVPMIPAPTREQQAALATQERGLDALDARLGATRTAWKWNDRFRPRIEALAEQTRAALGADTGVELLPKQDGESGEGPTGSRWRAAAAQPPPKVPADKLDFAGTQGVTVALWLRPEAENPGDVALFSSLNYVGNAADSQYGKGRELRLIDGELELRMSERSPVYAIYVRSDGARIRSGEWRHVAVTYAGGKKAEAVRMFVDGLEVATRVLFDGMPGEPPKREFLVGADNATDGTRWRGAFAGLRGFPRALDAAAVRVRFAAEALPFALSAVEKDPAPARNKTSRTGGTKLEIGHGAAVGIGCCHFGAGFKSWS